MNASATPSRRGRWSPALALLAVACSASVLAQIVTIPDAHLHHAEGSMAHAPRGETEWQEVEPRRVLKRGDRLWTDRGSRAELQAGGHAVRMDGQTQLVLENAGATLTQLGMTQGSIAATVTRVNPGDSFEVGTPNLALRARQPGDYRVDVDAKAGTTRVTVLSGNAVVFGAQGEAVELRSGQRAVFRDRDLTRVRQPAFAETDDFDRWAGARRRGEPTVRMPALAEAPQPAPAAAAHPGRTIVIAGPASALPGARAGAPVPQPGAAVPLRVTAPAAGPADLGPALAQAPVRLQPGKPAAAVRETEEEEATRAAAAQQQQQPERQDREPAVREQAARAQAETERRRAAARRAEAEQRRAAEQAEAARRAEHERRQAQARRAEEQRRQLQVRREQEQRRQAQARRAEEQKRQAQARKAAEQKRLALTRNVEEERRLAQQRLEAEKIAQARRLQLVRLQEQAAREQRAARAAQAGRDQQLRSHEEDGRQEAARRAEQARRDEQARREELARREQEAARREAAEQRQRALADQWRREHEVWLRQHQPNQPVRPAPMGVPIRRVS